MGMKAVLSSLFIILIINMLVFYWFIPFNVTEFGYTQQNSNFNLYSFDENMQFYSNMRYPEKDISYKIYNCPLQKKDDMGRAFEIVSNQSILDFYPVSKNAEIYVTCDSKNRIEEGLFIAGEGGPTNITVTSNFNVIHRGEILLIKESKCPKPNVAIHELLHVLGFNHSTNSNNIMYPVSKCKQTVGEDIFNLINEIYSTPSYPDLSFENVSAIMNGKYLDTEVSIRNNGLITSKNAKVTISSEGKIIKEFELESLNSGHGIVITFTNIWVSKLSVENLEFEINYNFDELRKDNNKVNLKIKN